ncbi:MAG: DUF3088 family protein [Litoreibacter sp.]|uniref:DUF3088 family protein n=1 Tax=Litoreibacter sp. TaxID=1969459 RepID=UPI0032979743
MSQAILYLLKPKFKDPIHGNADFFCPQCVPIEGLLTMFPDMCQNLDIRYVDFARPRGEMGIYVGDEQSCPQLILPNGDDTHSVKLSHEGLGKVRRIEDPKDVHCYLIARFGLPKPHP